MSDTMIEQRPAELQNSFKLAMRRMAASVTIVTTVVDGQAAGMTATAVTSLSADPPALIVCVNRSASIHALLTSGRPVCVNLLGEHHADLSLDFGGRVSPEKRFDSEFWDTEQDGVPSLLGARANIFCTVDGLFDYATHSIVACKVTRIRLEGEGGPLIYGEGRFIPMPPIT